MASGFFAILDDIAGLMDDVAATTKIATGKTAGILGDDLAVNAEKATGYLASRELPVLWSITKGSLLNKLIIVPIALALNVFPSRQNGGRRGVNSLLCRIRRGSFMLIGASCRDL